MQKYRKLQKKAVSSSLLTMYRNYVDHSDIIHRKGNPEIYRRMDRLDALDRCRSMYGWFLGKSNVIIAKVILKSENDLKRILPHPSNCSYISSWLSLVELLNQCNEIMNKIKTIHEN